MKIKPNRTVHQTIQLNPELSTHYFPVRRSHRAAFFPPVHHRLPSSGACSRCSTMLLSIPSRWGVLVRHRVCGLEHTARRSSAEKRMHHKRSTLSTDIAISCQSRRLSSTLSRSWVNYWVGGGTNTVQEVRNFSQGLKAWRWKELESCPFNNDCGFDEVADSTPNRERMLKTRVGPDTPVVSRHAPRQVQFSREDMMNMIRLCPRIHLRSQRLEVRVLEMAVP